MSHSPDRTKAKLSVTIPAGLLQDWTNTVTLTAQNGDYDTSLVQSIRITYPHLYVADSDRLKFTGRAGDELNMTGFTSAPTVLDITDPNHPVQVTGQVISNSGNYAIALQVPWTTTNPVVASAAYAAGGGCRSDRERRRRVAEPSVTLA